MLRPAALPNNKPTSYRNVASCDVHTNTSRRSASPEAAEERSGASGYPGSPSGDYIYIYRVIDRAPQNVTPAHSSYRSRWAPLRRGIARFVQPTSSRLGTRFPHSVSRLRSLTTMLHDVLEICCRLVRPIRSWETYVGDLTPVSGAERHAGMPRPIQSKNKQRVGPHSVENGLSKRRKLQGSLLSTREQPIAAVCVSIGGLLQGTGRTAPTRSLLIVLESGAPVWGVGRFVCCACGATTP